MRAAFASNVLDHGRLMCALGLLACGPTPSPAPVGEGPAELAPAPVAEASPASEPRPTPDREPPPAPAVADDVVDSVNDFGFDLYRQVAGHEEDVLVSPASLATTLAMLHRGGGPGTAAEIAAVLHADPGSEPLELGFGKLHERLNVSNERYEVDSANRLWPAKALSLDPSFEAALGQHYGASVERLSFGEPLQAEARINAWVAEHTRGRISRTLDGDLDAATRLVLGNTLYFKAQWRRRFVEAHTEDGDFTLASGTKVRVPLMHALQPVRHLEADAFRLAELPYAWGRASMLIFLPTGSFEDVETSLGAASLREWRKAAVGAHVRITLPRFELAPPSAKLENDLVALGLRTALGRQADYSRLSSEKVTIDRIVHTAIVKVDERGTEAAAATMAYGGKGAPKKIIEFRVDRPFLFAIVDESGAVLFLGRVLDPR